MRLTDEREQFIRETGGGFADIAVLLGEVDALRGERDAITQESVANMAASIEFEAQLNAALARAEAAEARIAAIETQLDAGYPTAFTDEQREGFAWLEGNLRAALAEPVEPQPSACATCGGTGWMPNPLPPMTTATDGNPLLPCPSCTPPPPPERRSAVFTRHEGGRCVHGPYHPADLECSP